MNDFTGLQALNKAPTGIEGFEHIAMGGLTEGRTALVAGSSGSGKTLFATEYLYRGITRFNHNAVFVTMEERPQGNHPEREKTGLEPGGIRRAEKIEVC